MARPRSFETEQVLRAAERQFAKSGYAGTSIQDLVDVTGLGRGSLYAAFGDKHDLFVAGVTDYCERREAEFGEALRGPDESALARLRAFVLSGARAVADNADHVGCMAARVAVELGGRDAAVAGRIREDFATTQAELRACIEGAQRHGDIAADADAAALARHIFAVVRGFEVLAAGGETVEDLEAAAESVLASLPSG